MVYLSKVILAIGAHPDDCELGCYATLAHHKHEGDDDTFLYFPKAKQGDQVTKESVSVRKLHRSLARTVSLLRISKIA